MPLSKAVAIKRFFEEGIHGRAVSFTELKALKEDPKAYDELAELAAKALGDTLEAPKAV